MAPLFHPDGYNAQFYGMGEGYPIGQRANYNQPKYMVGSFSQYDRVSPRKKIVGRADQALRFDYEPTDFTGVTYRPSDDAAPCRFEEYFERNPVTSFLLLKDNRILYERYNYRRRESDCFTSWSMAKTVVAMLVGIAEREQLIDVNADTGHYIPELANTSLARIPVKAYLQMLSGNNFTEGNYRGAELDITRMSKMLNGDLPAASRIEILRTFAKPPDEQAPAFKRRNYASFDTLVLGTILAKATGKSLSEYLEEKIWKRIGTESDAFWSTDIFGEELAHCCLNATLRDYGRFGRLLAHCGVWDSDEVIPPQWVADGTRLEALPSPLAPDPNDRKRYFGYGYQVHVMPHEGPAFSLRGIHGQAMYVHPASKLVLVHTSVNPYAVDPEDAGARKHVSESIRLWLALVRQLK